MSTDIKNETEVLHNTIRELKRKQQYELVLVKEQLHHVYESIKPINIIRNTLHDVSASSQVKSDIVDNAVSLTAGYISKRVVVGNSQNPMRKIAGRLAQFAITTLLSKYAGPIRLAGQHLFQRVLKPTNEAKQISRH
jgi:alanine dehydrogenase